MNTILNRLTSIATSFWTGYRRLPPVMQVAGGLVAVVVLTKLAWPIAFGAIIVTTVVLMQQEPEGN